MEELGLVRRADHHRLALDQIVEGLAMGWHDVQTEHVWQSLVHKEPRRSVARR